MLRFPYNQNKFYLSDTSFYLCSIFAGSTAFAMCTALNELFVNNGNLFKTFTSSKKNKVRLIKFF